MTMTHPTFSQTRRSPARCPASTSPQPLAARRRGGDRGGHGSPRRPGVPRPAPDRRRAARVHPQFRRAGGLTRRQHRDACTNAACRSTCRMRPTSTATTKPLARDDRRRMFNLGNRLWHSDSSYRAVPAKYSLLSGAYRGGPRRPYRVRRHARRLRCAGRRDEGRDRGSGLRTFADLLARPARLHRTVRPRSGRCSRRCASAWCARIR